MESQIVLFSLDDLNCALPLSRVVKVIRAVEITTLPKAPKVICGVINLAGQLVPVFNIRQRFRLPESDLNSNDRFIIAKSADRIVAMIVDAVSESRSVSENDLIPVEPTLSFAQHLHGVAKIAGDLILIYDLDQFLSLEEEQILNDALSSIDAVSGGEDE